jgi:hypothetical protein
VHPRSADRPESSARDREHERLVSGSGVACVGMPARRDPTDDDRHHAIDVALSGLARGDDLADLAKRLEQLHPRNDTFPGEVLLDLAADAIEISGATRRSPLEFEGIRERNLPEGVAHSKAQRHNSTFAPRAATMLHGNVDPGAS